MVTGCYAPTVANRETYTGSLLEGNEKTLEVIQLCWMTSNVFSVQYI